MKELPADNDAAELALRPGFVGVERVRGVVPDVRRDRWVWRGPGFC
jgi:hypothetical protein